MNPTDLPPDKEVRFSLDLPQSRHEKLEEMMKYLGFTSKAEATRRAIDLTHSLMLLAFEGNVPSVQHLETKQTMLIYGSELTTLARRALALTSK